MPRTAALKPEQVPADSKPTLDTFTKNIGFTPNMMSRVFTSSALLKEPCRVAHDVFDPEKDFPAVTPAGSI